MTDQNADIDGDQVNIHVPNSDAAVKDILENLLPSRNIISSSSFDVHHDPKQDYVAGLYLAGKPDMSRPVKEFATQEDAIKAYKAGKLSARDPVRILSNSK
jgi:DNA-directed RNA polymerase subunit A'